MRILVILIAFLFSFLELSAQQEKRLNLISSSGARLSKEGSAMFYRPVYEHNQSTLSADSGYIHEDELKKQFFEAFGNVVITQPSGTVIYSDKLHYDATTQLATLTGNVRMVDDQAVLTTNYLTYNLKTKYGTYSTGGRIVNQGDTITSKNAYYFENTKDAYFRKDVVVRTVDVKIYTDSMRYNSIERITYFYGPTNIKGNEGENLYTERGNYSTENGIAKFSLNNLYTEGSRFLKSDSLYFERQEGIGKAYNNVVFVDTLDKFYAYGGYGEYNEKDESITMTDKPLIISVVKEEKDSLQSDSIAAPLSVETDSLALNGDSLVVQRDTLAANRTALQDSSLQYRDSTGVRPNSVDSIYMTADTLYSKMIPRSEYFPLNLNLSRDGGQLLDEEEDDYSSFDITPPDESGETFQDSTAAQVQPDSLARPDSTQAAGSLLSDSTANLKAVDSVAVNLLDKTSPIQIPIDTAKGFEKRIERDLAADSILRQGAIIPQGHESDSLFLDALTQAQRSDTVKEQSQPTDTVKTRIIKAYYNVRMYKSNLQAVADSMYYGEQDSMFRFMGSPMIWSDGSQISADTIYMQIKNQQMDNALLTSNAFMVNAVLDSVKYNQLKGRKITAFFNNNQMEYLYVDGNAENLIFSSDDKKRIITEMFHDRSSRIKIKMENQEIIDYVSIQKVDQKVYPFSQVNQDNEILPGFIWRPQDRPTSKEDLLNRKRQKESSADTPPETPANQGLPDEGTPDEELQKAGEQPEGLLEEAEESATQRIERQEEEITEEAEESQQKKVNKEETEEASEEETKESEESQSTNSENNPQKDF